MSAMQIEVYEAFRDMGATENKALKAASVLGKQGEDLTTSVSDLRLELKTSLERMSGELALHRWMLGFVLAGIVAIIFKVFAH